MKFILRRNTFEKDGIFGELLDEKYNHICMTLEHAYLQPDGTYEPKLPDGEWKAVYEFSQKFGRKLWELKDVPGHTEIKFHVGNYNADSDGCILLGQFIGHRQDGGRMITNSKETLERFHAIAKDQPEITVEVEKIISIPSEKLSLA